MSTDRPAQPRRRIPAILRHLVPKPSSSAESLAEDILSRSYPPHHTTAVADAQDTHVLIESELAPSDELSTQLGETSETTVVADAQDTHVLIESELESSMLRGETSEAAAAILESLTGLWVFSIPTRTLHWRVTGAWWLGPVLSGALPLVLNGLLTLIYGRVALHTAAAWGWLTIFAITQAGALLAGRVLWGRLVRDMPSIVTMLPDKLADRKLARWIRSCCSVPRQAVAAVALSVLGAFILWLASPDVGPHLELGPVSYISVAWTCFMGGLLLYAFAVAILITVEISNCRLLILDPWDPASTPGLRTLSRGYIYCLCLVIVLAAGLEIVATRVPDYRASFVLSAFVVGFPIFAVLCGLLVSVVPHMIIAHLTYVSKIRTRDLIDEEIGSIKASMATDHGRLVTLVWLRNQVYSAPDLPIRAPWLVPLMAALLGPFLAFLLTLKL